MADEKVTIEIDLELDDGSTRTALAKITKTATQEGAKAGSGFGRAFSGAFSSFVGNVGAIAFSKALGSITDTLNGTVAAASKLEVFETQFKTILGSTQAAQKQLQDLQNFAATTPFQIDGLALATRQLLSFGVAQEDVIGTLSQLGDISAGVGANIDELTIPFGRLISTQKLTLAELDKFADRGVNIYQALADQTGRSIRSIRDDISKGAVDFEEFTKAIEGFTSEGGAFFRGAEAQSRTLAGLISTFQDNLFNLQGTIGKTFSSLFKTLVGDATVGLQNLNKLVQENSVEILRSFFTFARGFNDFVVRPISVLSNSAIIVFETLRTGIQDIIFFTIAGASKLVNALNFGGALNEFAQGLEDAKEISKSTADEFRSNLGEAIQNVFGEEDSFADKADAYLNNLQNTVVASNEIVAGAEKINPIPDATETQDAVDDSLNAFGAFKIGFDNSAKSIEATQKKLASSFKSVLVRGISTGIQNIVTNIMNGENAFANFGKFVLGVFGDMAIQLGQVLIGAGIGIESLKALGGGAAIAAGAGLVALGTVLKNLSGSSGATTAGASGGGGGVDTSVDDGGIVTDSFETEDEPELEDVRGTTIVINGDILGDEASGARIVDLINSAVDVEGVTIRSQGVA